MLKFVIEVAIAVWTTSTLFMLFYWANAFICTLRDGEIFLMPIGKFLYIHFCPIVHTVKCFEIMRRTAKLGAQAAKRGM